MRTRAWHFWKLRNESCRTIYIVYNRSSLQRTPRDPYKLSITTYNKIRKLGSSWFCHDSITTIFLIHKKYIYILFLYISYRMLINIINLHHDILPSKFQTNLILTWWVCTVHSSIYALRPQSTISTHGCLYIGDHS